MRAKERLKKKNGQKREKGEGEERTGRKKKSQEFNKEEWDVKEKRG